MTQTGTTRLNALESHFMWLRLTSASACLLFLDDSLPLDP